jgi:hypothetical protein
LWWHWLANQQKTTVRGIKFLKQGHDIFNCDMDDTSLGEWNFWLDQKAYKILDAEGGIKLSPGDATGKLFTLRLPQYIGVFQLVEFVIWNHEVVSSSLASYTIA